LRDEGKISVTLHDWNKKDRDKEKTIKYYWSKIIIFLYLLCFFVICLHDKLFFTSQGL